MNHLPLPPIHHISQNLFVVFDTCNVYVIRNGSQAVLVDFGSGEVLDRLDEMGIGKVADVLVTHHHRDQVQGLARAAAAGIRIWVPHTEQDLFQAVDIHWQAREAFNNYNVRQDRFSLLEPVPITGTLHDYARLQFSGQAFTVVPTPGHTVGSISLLTVVDGKSVAFTGDLIAAPGKVWSLSATQWSYNGAEGAAASIPSLLDLKDRRPDLLLPSHGDPIAEPGPAIDLLVERLGSLLEYRNQNPRLFMLREQPYVSLSEHLLWNRTSLANTYVLLSRSGKALFIDFGYDFLTGTAAGSDRASRRPWLYTLGSLKREFGVRKVDVAIATHYHDDHVAGFNLLREVEGTKIWAAQNYAGILEQPSRYDLPCLWYDPIPVDRVISLDQPFSWEEYELTLYEQPGHTLYAVAIYFEVDGLRVLCNGDQYQGVSADQWNYVYKNRFRLGDYRTVTALYQQLAPDLILPGHSAPVQVERSYLADLAERAAVLERLHHDLLPEETRRCGPEGAAVAIRPYQLQGHSGEPLEVDVEILNPFAVEEEAVVKLVVPQGWCVSESEFRTQLSPGAVQHARFHIVAPVGVAVRRARVAADLTIGQHRMGQQAEALVTID